MSARQHALRRHPSTDRLQAWHRLLFLFISTSVLAIGSAAAGTLSGSVQNGGIVAYYALVPAELVRGHSKGHEEAKMHGGVPKATNTKHLMVALFDAASGERIVDAKVSATLGEVGLTPESKALEAFTIADALTYGNYFRLEPKATHRLRIDINRSSAKATIRFELQFKPE